MFVLLFKNGPNDPTRNFSDKNCIPLKEIRDSNALIDKKQFFDRPAKSKQEAYEKLVEMSRNNDFTTGRLLDSLHYQKYYKLIGIVWVLNIPQ